MGLQRIHITGGPGSGKTTLAVNLAETLGVSHHDLDGLGLAHVAAGKPWALMGDEATRLAAQDAWVSDGAYLGWAEPLFARAELVVFMDVPWRVASYRIIVRHVKAELRRNNRFPGWRRLRQFWRWSRRYYQDRNEPGVDRYGVPRNHVTHVALLTQYDGRLLVCRSSRDVAALMARVTAGQPARLQ